MFRRILVCLDRSELAERALPFACSQARNFGSKVILLHVCKKDFKSFDLPASGQYSFVPIALLMEEFHHRWNQSSLYLRRIADRLLREGVEAEPVVIEGSGTVPESISSFAAHNDIDLIAMATHGRTSFMRFLIGSVSADVATRVAMPVLLVKRPSSRTILHPSLIPGLEGPDTQDENDQPDWQTELDPVV